MMPRTKTTARKRLEEVDGLRAVACLMVLSYHTWQFADLPMLSNWIEPLNAGVDLFIVLSGFCLFLPIVRDPRRYSAAAFWLQRFRRLAPAYYASILYVVLLPEILVVFWRVIGNPASWQPVPGPFQWLTHITFTHTLFPSTLAGINGSYWSLGLEAQFYLTMPALVYVYRRLGVSGLLVPASVSILWNIGVHVVFGQGHSFESWPSVLEISFLARWIEFVAGAGAAWLVTQTSTGSIVLGIGKRRAAVGCGLFMLGIELFLLRGHSMAIVDLMVLALGVSTLLVGISSMPAQSPLLVTRLLRWTPIRFLGMISYSFYLIHQPTEWFLSQFLKGLGLDGFALWSLELTLGTACITLLAFWSFRIFERPFLGSSYSPGVRGTATAGEMTRDPV